MCLLYQYRLTLYSDKLIISRKVTWNVLLVSSRSRLLTTHPSRHHQTTVYSNTHLWHFMTPDSTCFLLICASYVLSARNSSLGSRACFPIYSTSQVEPSTKSNLIILTQLLLNAHFYQMTSLQKPIITHTQDQESTKPSAPNPFHLKNKSPINLWSPNSTLSLIKRLFSSLMI